jgi:hypothetical protein
MSTALAFDLVVPGIQEESRQFILTSSLTDATKDWVPPEEKAAAIAPDEWADWLRTLFPKYVNQPFGERHVTLWDHVWSIELDSSPRPFIGIWSRGGGKSTSAELAAVALGTRGKRRYCLYVRDTQDRADDSVSNIASQLESPVVGRYYPRHANRKMSKYGSSRGWRRNRVWTAGGFVVDAIGLDTAARGVKLEEQRPDLFIFDDIDGKHDTLAMTMRKIDIITTSIAPAGSTNAAAIAIQNLITPNGFFARMSDGRAGYFARRKVSGPHPAIFGLKTEWRDDAESGTRRAIIIAGTPSWEGQNLETCQKQIDDWGLDAFEKEAQHDVYQRPEGLALRFRAAHGETLDDDECKRLVKFGQAFGGIDFGAWRFGFILRAADLHGVPHQIAEYFAQKSPHQNHDVHAKAIHAICTFYGCPDRLRIWGDAANPSDITELNRAFKRIDSPFRVVAVAQQNKIRLTSVDRMNTLLDKHALKYRNNVRTAMAPILATVNWQTEPGQPALFRPAGEFLTWLHGQSATSPGTAVKESRLIWEVKHWSYKIEKEGKAQSQDPDDHSADGADLLASDRYAIMSWWRAGHEPEEPDVDAFTPEALAEHAESARTLKKRMGKKRHPRMVVDDDD